MCIPVALTCNEGSVCLETLIDVLVPSAVGLGRLMLMHFVDFVECEDEAILQGFPSRAGTGGLWSPRTPVCSSGIGQL